MSRPTILGVGNVQYWTISLYDSSGALVDADSTPTVAIRKNGSSTSDVVTVTKRAATTGIYDCSYNPGNETGDDTFCVEETATISSTAYFNSWEFSVIDKALTESGVRSSLGMALNYNLDTRLSDILSAIGSLNDFDPSTDTVTAAVQSVATDAIDAAAIKADAVAEIQTGLATATELANVPKLNTQYTHTAQSGDTIQVTIS